MMEHITITSYAPKLRKKDRYLIDRESRYTHGIKTTLAQEGTSILCINRYGSISQATTALERYLRGQKKLTKEDFVIVELNLNVDQYVVADASDPLPNKED